MMKIRRNKGISMVDITFRDLDGSQARVLIKFADMMKASTEIVSNTIRETVNGETRWVNLGNKPRYPETFKNVEQIEEIINNDPLY